MRLRFNFLLTTMHKYKSASFFAGLLTYKLLQIKITTHCDTYAIKAGLVSHTFIKDKTIASNFQNVL